MYCILQLGSIAQSAACLTASPDTLSSSPQPGLFTFVEIDHKIISTAILPLPLIQEGHLSVTGKSIGTKYWLTV